MRRSNKSVRRRASTSRRSGSRRKRLDPITTGAYFGGIVGLACLIYGFLGDNLPEGATSYLSTGFAITLGVVLVVVAAGLQFCRETGIVHSRRAVSPTRRRVPSVRRRRTRR
jgi:hypothetical protein